MSTRWMVIAVAMACALAAHGQDDTKQKLFERVFGDAARLDMAVHQSVLAAKPGERVYIDRDNDGDPDEVWFVDRDLRHPAEWQPLVVRVMDEDDDLEDGFEPDHDSDLYIADWKGDGTVDSACDYTDRDGDGDVDEMLLYFPTSDKQRMMIWWGDDIGDDNLLWYDIGYTYNQRACQYRCHFGGDELFCAYTIGLDDAEWLPAFENPFLFYDRDQDGVTEEVIRIGGRGDKVENLRYSFDADDDGTPDSPRNFDVSISAHATPEILFDPAVAESRTIRGIPTGRFLSFTQSPDWARQQVWSNMLLCWVEDDLNIDSDGVSEGKFTDTQERWEGVICKGNDFFKQIGGPSCGLLNKRYEVDDQPAKGISVYFSGVDHRVHLKGADHAWMLVDFDYDLQPDMRYDYLDTDGDGYIDTWRVDIDMDGTPDEEWKAGGDTAHDIPYTWESMRDTMVPVRNTVPEQTLHLVLRLTQALSTLEGEQKARDAAGVMLFSGFAGTPLSDEVRDRLVASVETHRFFLDILKDRLIIRLKQAHNDAAFWARFDEVRGCGYLDAMRALVESAFELDKDLPLYEDVADSIRRTTARPGVDWAQDWTPPNIAWESEVSAYRAYWGQFDFFGKKKPGLVARTFGAGYDYHQEQDWGMDALNVGTTCGLGGVTLYVNGTPYPVWSPKGEGAIEWSKRLLEQSDGELAVELIAEKAGPAEAPWRVRFECQTRRGYKHSDITVTAEGGKPGDALEIGIGLTKLKQENFLLDGAAGVMASRGLQTPAIGWVGLGVRFPAAAFLRGVELDDMHQVVLKAAPGEPMAYAIQGDWLRGRRFPYCPTIENWVRELAAIR